MTISEFKKDDYLRLKWHMVLLTVCIVAIGAMFFFINKLNIDANRQLNIARGDMNSAQTALDQIEEEETTINEYIGRYLEIDAAGIVGPGDRLNMQEKFAQIRAQFSLFPIQLDIGSQTSFVLPYDPAIAKPGQPVTLQKSIIETSLPLLHENDLSNFLDALLNDTDLLLAESCSIKSSNRESRDFLRLGQHMNASCTFDWYTFAVQADTGEQP
jgi:hypothetical protein